MGWYLKPGTLLEMGVADAAAGASELGTRRKICKIAKAKGHFCEATLALMFTLGLDVEPKP